LFAYLICLSISNYGTGLEVSSLPPALPGATDI
jgi:hypothetical protein